MVLWQMVNLKGAVQKCCNVLYLRSPPQALQEASSRADGLE